MVNSNMLSLFRFLPDNAKLIGLSKSKHSGVIIASFDNGKSFYTSLKKHYTERGDGFYIPEFVKIDGTLRRGEFEVRKGWITRKVTSYLVIGRLFYDPVEIIKLVECIQSKENQDLALCTFILPNRKTIIIQASVSKHFIDDEPRFVSKEGVLKSGWFINYHSKTLHEIDIELDPPFHQFEN